MEKIKRYILTLNALEVLRNNSLVLLSLVYRKICFQNIFFPKELKSPLNFIQDHFLKDNLSVCLPWWRSHHLLVRRSQCHHPRQCFPACLCSFPSSGEIRTHSVNWVIFVKCWTCLIYGYVTYEAYFTNINRNRKFKNKRNGKSMVTVWNVLKVHKIRTEASIH